VQLRLCMVNSVQPQNPSPKSPPMERRTVHFKEIYEDPSRLPAPKPPCNFDPPSQGVLSGQPRQNCPLKRWRTAEGRGRSVCMGRDRKSDVCSWLGWEPHLQRRRMRSRRGAMKNLPKPEGCQVVSSTSLKASTDSSSSMSMYRLSIWPLWVPLSRLCKRPPCQCQLVHCFIPGWLKEQIQMSRDSKRSQSRWGASRCPAATWRGVQA
jgi:hypothetical protein